MSTAQPTVKQKGYAYSTADGANPRAEAVCGLIAIIAIAVFGAVGLFFLFLAAAFTNGVVLTGLTGSYAVFETVHLAWGELALEPIRTGDIEAQQEWIKFVNPLENGYNSMLTLCQIGISVWDYSYGILIFLVQLFFDIAVPIFKFVFATLGPYIMEFLLFRVEATRIFLQVVVQIFQALAVSLNGSEFEQDAIDTSGGGSAGPVGGDVGAVPGETVGGLPLNFINSFRKVSRFFLRGYTVIAFGIATILQALNVDVLTLITWFLNIFVKYMPLLMEAIIYVVNLLDPQGPLGRVIFGVLDLAFSLFRVIFGICELQEAYLKIVCLQISAINSITRKIENKLHVNLPNLPNCNINTIGKNCIKPPDNPFSEYSFFGVGICDATVCASETIAIIDLLAQRLPNCNDWSANATATMACMAVTYEYSATMSNYTGDTPIDAIAKELCFVLTVLVNNQCASFNPPFSFNYAAAANSICVEDRSGLVPPALPFNDQCACIFTAPLCDAGCCNQYSRHVAGQVSFYIGGYTCGQVLVQFPETFWCQFSTVTAATITPSSDYTFSQNWCQAYLQVVYPACALASPLATLGAMMDPALVTAFSETACNQTVHQTGVCVRINTTTDASFVDFEYSLGGTSVPDIIASAPPLGSTLIVSTPTAATPVDQLAFLEIQKYYGYAFFQQFNASMVPALGSPMAAVMAYSQDSLADQYGNFDLETYTTLKLITPTGEIQPIDLASIPLGVSPFQGVVGGGVPPRPNEEPACLSGSTGYNPQEVSYQQQCTTYQQNIAVGAADATAQSGLETQAALEQNSVAFAPAAHLNPVGGQNASSPNATVNAIEASQLTAASQLPTNWQIITPAETVSTTSNFRTNYPTPPPNAGTGIYIQYKNNPAGRTLLGVVVEEKEPGDDEETIDFDGPEPGPPKPDVPPRVDEKEAGRAREAVYQIFQLAKAEFDVQMARMVAKLDEIRIDDPRSTRRAAVMSAAAARRGKARLMRGAANVLAAIRDPTSRRLFASGNADIDYYVNQFWDTAANTNIENTGISEESEVIFLANAALNDVRIIFSHTANVWLVGLYNYLYAQNVTVQDLDEAGLDYAYEVGGGGSTGRCKNTLEEPLRCCTATTSPYGCCYGLPILCIPMVPDYFYAPITTLDNIDEWRCTKYNGFFEMWAGTTKTIVTAVVKSSLLLAPGDFSGFAKTTLGWVTWPNFDVPPYSLQCMFVNGKYIMLGILILWILAVFLTLEVISRIATASNISALKINGAWNGKSKRD